MGKWGNGEMGDHFVRDFRRSSVEPLRGEREVFLVNSKQ
jgi:hypothetical protein